jgi:mono/diheme cytochrome c family protein
MSSVLRALLILVVVVAIGGGIAAYTILSRGLSTRVEPSAAERTIARAMRHMAVPRAVRSRPNPVHPTHEVLDDALAHFADHCAGCHGNDGRGRTEVGRSLYPPAPDMRARATQELSDGELFSIIENGIRLTGMPAWSTGTPEGERATWALVHFIRRLPSLRPEDIARMEALNPKSFDEFQEQEEARRFLAGKNGSPPPHERPAHKAGHQ